MMLVLALCTSVASTAAADLDVILFGATGCVGHLAADYLAGVNLGGRNLSWAIADINATRLSALAAELAAAGGPSAHPTVITATLDGKTNLTAFVSRAKAVITAAGPFSVHDGDALLSACAENGVHYADVSDEFYWQRRMVDGYDQLARVSGAKVVLSAGFCALAGDLGAQLALAQLSPAAGTVSDVDAWLERYNGGISAGVIATENASAHATFPKAWAADPYVLAPKASASLRLDTTVTGISRYPAKIPVEGTVVSNLFGSYDARLLRRTFTQKGQPVRLRVGALPSLYTRWTEFVALHPIGALAKCPDATVLRDGSWSYRFRAAVGNTTRGTAPPPPVVTTEVLLGGIGDPGYHFTAVGLAETGLCLAEWIPGCAKAGGPGGVAPAMVHLDPAATLKRLEAIGLVTATVATSTTTAGMYAPNGTVTDTAVDPEDLHRALAALRKLGARVD